MLGANPSTNGANYSFNTGNAIIADSDNANVSVLEAGTFYTATSPTDELGNPISITPVTPVDEGGKLVPCWPATTGPRRGHSACARRTLTSRSGSLRLRNGAAGPTRAGPGCDGSPGVVVDRARSNMNITSLSIAVRATLAMSAAGAALAGSLARAQVPELEPQAGDPAAVSPAAPGELEEVIVEGRQRTAAEDVIEERIKQEVVTDIVSAEQISRVGDSSVSLALRRLPAVTMVGDQFIYVRGLGERYSSTTLNGAYVPSPDLTRNVIPLDLFPAEIVESLSIQKGYSPDKPAAFGGGSVDIRTRGIPDRLVLDFEVGTGYNTDSDDDGLSYPGGSDDKWGTDDGTRALPADITTAINDFQGDLSPTGIFEALNRDGEFHTIGEAEQINREIATSLNRNLDFREESLDPDLSLEGTVGNPGRSMRAATGKSEPWRSPTTRTSGATASESTGRWRSRSWTSTTRGAPRTR